jgi:diaminopimelate decarboxylase
MFDAPLSAGLAIDDRVFLYTAGAYTTAYASEFNGFGVPRSYVTEAPQARMGPTAATG